MKTNISGAACECGDEGVKVNVIRSYEREDAYHGPEKADADQDVAPHSAKQPPGHDVHDERHDRERQGLERGTHGVVSADLLVEQSDEVAQRVVARPAVSHTGIRLISVAPNTNKREEHTKRGRQAQP